jgi:uncharacterized protein involved in exopolysaccharide biosynthesis
VTSARTGDEISLVHLIIVVLRERGLIAGCAATVAALIVLVTLILPRTYTVHASFTAQAPRLPSNVAGLAAQIGIALPAADAASSPSFYVGLVSSRRILDSVIETRYTFLADTGMTSGTLVEILKIKPDTKERRHARALRKMGRIVSASLTREIGVVNLAVETRNPQLSAQIAGRVLELVNEFNLHTRQSQAAAERRFTERRLAEARQELLEVENRLQTFLLGNREFRSSPVLTFQQERLAREVTVRQAVVNALSQSHEQARIDEVRDTPVITLVDPPDPPALPDPRNLPIKGALALLAGGLFGILLAFMRQAFRNRRAEAGEELAQFRELRQATARDLQRPWELVWRLARRTSAR